jgi:hypothetical protein
MALQRAFYRPRDAEHTVLHQVIAEHLEVSIRALAAAGAGAGLPQFVEREFRKFLDVVRIGARDGVEGVHRLRIRSYRSSSVSA